MGGTDEAGTALIRWLIWPAGGGLNVVRARPGVGIGIFGGSHRRGEADRRAVEPWGKFIHIYPQL